MQYLKSRSVQTYYGPLLQLLMQHKDNHGIFNTPVNPEVQNLPTYYDIVEHPMDLGTVRDNLMCGRYQQPRDLIADIRLVFQNAKKFNPETHFVNQCATQMLKTLDVELEKVRNRYEQNRLSQYNHTCNSCRGYPCLICGDKCLKYSPPVYVCDGGLSRADSAEHDVLHHSWEERPLLSQVLREEGGGDGQGGAEEPLRAEEER